jgi:hypothetical protein
VRGEELARALQVLFAGNRIAFDPGPRNARLWRLADPGHRPAEDVQCD